MPTRVLVNTFHVAADPKEVFDHLATPESYVGLSPLVVAVRDVDRSDPDVVRYTSIERFAFGPFRYDNPIAVTLRTDGLAVYGEVRSPGRVRMRYRFDLSPEDGGTRVEDRLELDRPLVPDAVRRGSGAPGPARPGRHPRRAAGRPDRLSALVLPVAASAPPSGQRPCGGGMAGVRPR